MVLKEQFYVFMAYNTERLYGYGTAEDAEAYCDILNENREVNLYSASPLTIKEAMTNGLIVRDDVIVLDDELTEREQ